MSKLSLDTFQMSFPNTDWQTAENMRFAQPCTLKVDRSERTHCLLTHTQTQPDLAVKITLAKHQLR